MTTLNPVRGGWSLRGYKKGGGEARTPVEAPDSLRSTSYARVLDLVSEGEIYGPVKGLQSMYLNEKQGLSLLVSKGLLTEERKAEIVAEMQPR